MKIRGGKLRPQCKDIPDAPILEFLSYLKEWATHYDGTCMPSVGAAMPYETPIKLRVAKMAMLKRRKLVDGCECGCRGDWEITEKGKLCLYTNANPVEL